jgi:flavodoxin/ferredoxin
LEPSNLNELDDLNDNRVVFFDGIRDKINSTLQVPLFVSILKKECNMNSFRSNFGRRNFILTAVSSLAVTAFGGVSRAFYLLFGDRVAKASETKGSSGKKALKGCVVYYSGTGGTAKIAGGIYRGVKSVMDCDVSPIDKIDPKKMDKYDFIVIGTPIWFFRETANVRLFIYHMPNTMAGKLCAIFCTHGTEPSGTFNSLSQPIKKKAMTIIGWNDWYGDTTQYIHALQPYITHGHPDDIDLKEAEAFGREMAERAEKIYSGDKSLIPELPIDQGTEKLWVQRGTGGQPGGGKGDGQPPGGGSASEAPPGHVQGSTPSIAGAAAAGIAASKPSSSGVPQAGSPGADRGSFPGGSKESDGKGPMMMASNEIPVIDTSKCVYPRCTACVDNCIVQAIDLSMAAPAAWISGSPIFVQGCVHCGFPLCQRSCPYDAITYKGQRQEYAFDMTRCIYPKCTLCADHCGMKSIDLTKKPFVRHLNCEGCDLCWSICPTDAISITNLDDKMTSADLMRAITRVKQIMPKFRQLILDGEWGVKGKQYENKITPRVVLNEKDWPYQIS